MEWWEVSHERLEKEVLGILNAQKDFCINSLLLVWLHKWIVKKVTDKAQVK